MAGTKIPGGCQRKRKSTGMLNAACAPSGRLDGIETLLTLSAEPLDLSLRKGQTDTVGCKSSTRDTGIDISKHEVSTQFQTSTRYSEMEKVQQDNKTPQYPAQQQISVLRPAPIYCRQPVNSSLSNTYNENCQRKTVYPHASMLNLENSYSSSIKSNVSSAHNLNLGTQVGQGILGIFKRKRKSELMKLDRWHSGPCLSQEEISMIYKNCELMKFEQKEDKNRMQDQLLPGGSVERGNDNMGVSKSLDTCEEISFDGKSRENLGQEKCQGRLKEGTGTSSEIGSSFDVLYECLINGDEKSFLDTLPCAEDGENLPVLEGCEEILDPESLQERLDERGARIPDLVEPTVLPSLDCIKGCRFSPFSVVNRFSQISQCSDEILYPSSLSLTSCEEKAEKAVGFSPQNFKPNATVSLFKEKPTCMLSELGNTSVAFHRDDMVQTPVTPSVEASEENTILDLSTSRDHSSFPNPTVDGDITQMEKSHNTLKEKVLCANKPAVSFLQGRPTETILSSSQLGSTSVPGGVSVVSSLYNKSTSSSKKKSILPSRHKKSTLFPKGESILSEPAVSFLQGRPTETIVSSSRLESTSVPGGVSVVSPLYNKSISSSKKKSILPSLHKESTLFPKGESILPEPAVSFLQGRPTETIVSSSQLESTYVPGGVSVVSPLYNKSISSSKKKSILPLLPKESTLFPKRESILPSLHKESTLFPKRESILPSLHKESTLFPKRESILPSLHKESTLFPNRESILPSLHKESTLFSCREPIWHSFHGESTLLPSRESNSSTSNIDLKISSGGKEQTLFPVKYSTGPPSFQQNSNVSYLDKEPMWAFPHTDVVQSSALNDLSSFVQEQVTNLKRKSSTTLPMLCDSNTKSHRNTEKRNSPFKVDLERDIKTPSLFSAEEFHQGVTQKVRVLASPPPVSPMPRLQIHSSLMPHLPILMRPNVAVITPSLPNSPNRFSSIQTHTTNVPIFTSSCMPIRQVFTSSPNSPNSPSHLSPMPKMSDLTSVLPNSPCLKTSSASNLKMDITHSVPNLSSSNTSSPPSCTTEKKTQQGTRLSSTLKHKQMLIEKYNMSVHTDTANCTSGINQCAKLPSKHISVEKPAADFPVAGTRPKRRKHKRFKTDKKLTFSDLKKEVVFPEAKKRLTDEYFDFAERSAINHSRQLDPCESFYWCHVCEKSVKCEKEANRHMTTHGFNTKANLLFYYLQVYGCVTLHWRGYNRSEKCVYLCGLCDQTIPYINGFKRHIQTHGNSICCDVCNKCFNDAESLLEHKLSHSESKSLDQEGGEGFTSRGNRLPGNSQTCSSDTIRCKYCGKFFSSRGSLTIHVRLHTGQNPYKCQLCDRSYPQNVQLKLHMKTHVRLDDIKE